MSLKLINRKFKMVGVESGESSVCVLSVPCFNLCVCHFCIANALSVSTFNCYLSV
jgi:tRNA threonylcarbamoyladenosine modification (KEOPS) complex Cgi121 subunit